MIRDQGRTTQVSSSSWNLTSILDNYVPEWMGEDAFDDLCFHPPWVQSFVCFALPMNPLGVPASSRMIFAECESSKTPRQSQLIRAEHSSKSSSRSHRALAGSSRTRAQADHFLQSTASSQWSLRDGDSDTRRPCWTFSSCLLPSRFPLFFGSPILLFVTFSTLLRRMAIVVCGIYLVMDVWLLRYGWPSSTWSRGRRLRAPSQGTVFSNRHSVCSCAGSLGECELPGSRVHLPVCVECGLLLLHLEKKCKGLPVSGFHLEVQCSDQYKGYRGSFVQPGRFSVYVSEGICKRNERQRFSIWNRDGSRALFRYHPLCSMIYVLRRARLVFRFSRACEGQTASGPGVASSHVKPRRGR